MSGARLYPLFFLFRGASFLELSSPPRPRGVTLARVALEPQTIQATIGDSRYLQFMYPDAPRP